MDKKPTISQEMYLKAIHFLSQREEAVRSIDIADFLKVSKPSVSVAMKGLSLDGLIEKDLNYYITLTSRGRRYALSVTGKYEILFLFLVNILGVDVLSAELEADRMEHVVSNETISRIEAFYKLRKNNCIY